MSKNRKEEQPLTEERVVYAARAAEKADCGSNVNCEGNALHHSRSSFKEKCPCVPPMRTIVAGLRPAILATLAMDIPAFSIRVPQIVEATDERRDLFFWLRSVREAL